MSGQEGSRSDLGQVHVKIETSGHITDSGRSWWGLWVGYYM